jgi:site-specific DNA recombinase
VERVFLQVPSGTTPEDQLLVQFQGMIAEYERAQIAERSRRGKSHRAQQGSINVLSGAPYGYRYVRKSDISAAYYEVIESEAAVVRRVYEVYTQQGLSINAIARLLNEDHVPTRTETTRWERSTVWEILRNPANRGRAWFGKTELRPRQRITRRLRRRQGLASRDSAHHERPRQDWIEIPVLALISEETFALAQEQLELNRRHSPRRTIEPSLLQGMLVCERCGYALYRTSTRISARKLYYYRCLGSDAYRHLKGAVCDNPPVRQDHLDAVVWKELLRQLEDPSAIQGELHRRREAARHADPLKQREEILRRDHAPLEKSMDRLLNAYQDGLVSLDELRSRMPELRKKQHAIQAEWQSLEAAAADDTQCRRLVETLADFCALLRLRADTLQVPERQKILRLLVKEILVGRDTPTIRHSIRVPNAAPDPSGTIRPPHAPEPPPTPQPGSRYLLRSSRDHSPLRNSFLPMRLEDHLEKPHHLIIPDSLRDLREQQIMLNAVKVGAQIKVNDAGLLPDNRLSHSVYRLMGRSLRSVSVRSRLKIRFKNQFQDQLECSLHHPITDRGYREDADLSSAFLRDLHLPHSHGLIRVRDQFVPDLLKKTLHSARFDGLEGYTVNARCPLVFLRHRVGFPKGLLFANMIVQSPESPGRFSLRLDVSALPQVLQTAGCRCHPTLASLVVRAIAISRVPWLHGHCSASPLLWTSPTPSRHPPISRGLRLYGFLLRGFLHGTRWVSPVAQHALVIVLSLQPRKDETAASARLRRSMLPSTSGYGFGFWGFAFSRPYLR